MQVSRDRRILLIIERAIVINYVFANVMQMPWRSSEEWTKKEARIRASDDGMGWII